MPKLNETAYSLADASEAFYLKQAKELKNGNYHPLKMNSTLFVHKPKGQTMWDAATAAHVEDSPSVRKKNIEKDAQQKIKEKFRFSSIEDLPFRFLGLNNRGSQYRELIENCQHQEDGLEAPDNKQLVKKTKQETLSQELQPTFRR